MQALQTLTWNDTWYLAPEIVLAAFTIALALLDLSLPRRIDRDIIGWGAVLGLVTAGVFVGWHIHDLGAWEKAGESPFRNLLDGSYRVDDFGNLLKLVFLGASALIVLASLGTVKKEEVPIKGEFYYLVLPAVLGAMVMASSGDLITLFIGMELLGIASYILVGVRKSSGLSGEAAFKYVVTGGTASAFVLYGMSFLYGATGSTRLSGIAQSIGDAVEGSKALVYVAFFLMIVGFALKLALAPFHAWAPDVYQGAPTPVTSFLGVVAKAAAFAMLYRLFVNTALYAYADTAQVREDLFLALAVLAAAAMIVGVAGALRQQNAKRLLALSGVANAGILLVPLTLDITSFHSSLFSEFIYYLLAYVFMNVGAFAVLTVVSRETGSEELSGFAGLYHRAPWTAAAMTALICSLAGLPVTGGFFGKLFILFGTVQTKQYWLAAILLFTTVVSYYLYFSFIRQMFMRSGDTERQTKVPMATGLVVWICAIASVALGVLPKPILEWVDGLFSVSLDFLSR
ncbi:NADH-quinone oxidoreductase subunit N [Cohnella thailandensis]|uniref:NADH-quinone oxidoreductase subunit N n=1 Tax=Cohnella thailandensis TaxID=557557 RepID=A0A841T559_9BACL|nr:NADH-quinone oxidoreductase subunit N [Cohnella thailandensis]MBB6638109.1 NADH-quinone oxidoreductase subunit N [Cohnella thailandensis]MBP1971965.1 NADH-quinone oxidoreductase subunit N [Cohnella thailandensis]